MPPTRFAGHGRGGLPHVSFLTSANRTGANSESCGSRMEFDCSNENAITIAGKLPLAQNQMLFRRLLLDD